MPTTEKYYCTNCNSNQQAYSSEPNRCYKCDKYTLVGVSSQALIVAAGSSGGNFNQQDMLVAQSIVRRVEERGGEFIYRIEQSGDRSFSYKPR